MNHTDIPKLLKKYGSLRAIARASGLTYDSVRRRYVKALEAKLLEPLPSGAKPRTVIKHPIKAERVQAMKPKRARHKCYILTSAQNNTQLHEGTWENIKALAEFYGAAIYVSTYLYARNTKFQRRLDKGTSEQDEDIWYDKRILPYVNNQRTEIAKGLVWCGELNISPTASRPLSKLEVYTGRASMIIPHPRHAMQPVATFDGATKLNYTTGTVTLRNYIQRKEGFVAEFFHTYGGVLVEVDDDGHWWVRQLNADSEGTLHDWDVVVKDGKVTTGNSVEAIQPGDCHVDIMDPVAKEVMWGEGGVVDQLRPKYQFIHDVYDGGSRSHHNRKDPYKNILRRAQGREDVKAEVSAVARFLREIKRDGCTTVVVNSNHDRHLDRWLSENDGRWDPVNAHFWSWLNNVKVDYIEAMGAEPDLLDLAITMMHPGEFAADNGVIFLQPGKSFVICKDASGGIECGMHGDMGANGSRGNLRGFASMGRRSNTGHDHCAGIDGGAYKAGTMTGFKVGYNDLAPSAWTQTFIITYPNGKRSLATIYDGKARA